MADLNRAIASPNDDAAFRSLLRAAEAGCLRAQALAGLAYHTGRGVAVDFARAADWYRKAAGAGDSYAIANLGVLNLLGQGMPADDLEAYTWLQSAVGLGHERLRPALDQLERRIAGNPDPVVAWVLPEVPPARTCTMPACDPCRCEAA
ncbi:MAG: tetratricopeptide repeat protein [Ignavibacteriota bacterium]